MEFYKENDPQDPRQALEASHLGNVACLQRVLDADSAFVKKELRGFTQRHMHISNISSWGTIGELLQHDICFFEGNQVVVYNNGAFDEKGKHEIVPLLLPVAGFVHQTMVCLKNRFGTELTASWLDGRHEAATGVLFTLIQLALASQDSEIQEGSDTPSLVQVNCSADENKPATLILSPDQLIQLPLLGDDDCKDPDDDCKDPSDNVLEFIQVVFTATQLPALLMTAGQVTLTNCLF